MSSRIGRGLAVAAGLAAVGGLCAAQAQAASTYSVSAGSAKAGTTVAITGKTTGASPQIHFSDVTTGQSLTCTSGTAPGTTKVGKGLGGSGIGHITGPKTTWNGCTGPAGLKFTVTGAKTWNINATSYSGGVSKGTISAVSATVNDPGVCKFTVTGSVPITYTNSSTTLAVTGGSSLKISAVTGCLGIINGGDKASFKGSYKLTASVKADNPVHITSP